MKGLNRREFLSLAAGGAAAAVFPLTGCDGGLAGRSRPAAKRPNIIVIMSDEHNAEVLGCYGNGIVRTTNLDGLAARGITFENCYTSSPLCAPARLAFTAGKYISRIGAWSNRCWLPSADYPSLPRIMNAAGYESLLCGKMHYDPTRRYGFTQIGDNLNSYFKDGKTKRRVPDDLNPKAGISKRFDEFYPGDESNTLQHDRRVTAAATALLNARKADEKPFFLLVGYLAPHFPLIVPQKYWDSYKGKVPMPVIPKGHLESQARNYKHLRIAFNVEDVPDEVVEKGRELYYGLTQWLDEQIGEVLKALAESEVADNTMVIYTTDHGENMGEHGLWWKNCMYESAAHVPLIISWPARWEGSQRRAGVCSLVDLVQTIAEVGGAEVPDDWNGSSMVSWMDNPNQAWKDMAVSEYYAHNIASGFVMIRMGRYKYVYHTPAGPKHPAERELYDLKVDREEFNNLVEQQEQKQRLEVMHAELVKELGEHPDKTERRCRADCERGYSRGNMEQEN